MNTLRKKILTFLVKIAKRTIKYLFCILPIILISKSVFLCYSENLWTFTHFNFFFIQNIPFFSKYLLEILISNENLLNFFLSPDSLKLPVDSLILHLDPIKIRNNELMVIGGLAGCFAWSLLETFSIGLKPAIAGLDNSNSSVSKDEISKELNLSKKGSEDSPSSANSSNPSPDATTSGSNINPEGRPSSEGLPSASGSKNNLEAVASSEGKILNPDQENEDNIRPALKLALEIVELAHAIKIDTKEYLKSILALSKCLEDFCQIDFSGIDITKSDAACEPVLSLLQKQCNYFSNYCKNKSLWIDGRSFNALPETKENIKELQSKAQNIQLKFWERVDEIKKVSDKSTQLKLFYAAFNEYRNSMTRELNKMDQIIIKDIKTSPISKVPGVMAMLNIEYSEAKLEYNKHDSYLRKKVGEIINKKK